MTHPASRSVSKERLRLLAQLAELKAEVARKPLVVQQARLASLQRDATVIKERRSELREGVDATASSGLPPAAAAYFAARSEDLGISLAASYQKLARATADMSEVKDAAARARARANILSRLSEKSY